MRTKLLLTIVILVIVLIFINNTDKSIPEKHTPDNPSAVNLLKPNATNQAQAVLKELNPTEPNDKIKAKVIMAVAIVYDNDPVVDANLIINNNVMCFRHLSSNKKSLDSFNRFRQKMTPKQKQFYDDFHAHCQQLNRQHPEYNLTDINVLKDQKDNAIATSFWGQILNGEIDSSTLSDYEINSLLKQNDLNILSSAPKILGDYYLKVIHWEIEDILQNHQYDYTNLILHYAHQLYLCQLGADCSPNSTIMASLCYLNSQGCGLNYPEYTNNVLSPGQQADIQLAMIYLQNRYQ